MRLISFEESGRSEPPHVGSYGFSDRLEDPIHTPGGLKNEAKIHSSAMLGETSDSRPEPGQP